MRYLVLFAIVLIPFECKGETMGIPDDFPRFAVPGFEKQMESLRELYWLHYPGAGPKATLWDPWLPTPSLWPAVEGSSDAFRQQWNDVLSSRMIDKEGYVSVHQHASIAHPLGWPFPYWHGGVGGMGWHFSFKDTVDGHWRPANLNTTEGWQTTGIEDKGIGEYGWDLRLAEPRAMITAPKHDIDTFQSPFLQLRWKASGLGNAEPFVEWTTKEHPRFGPDRRMYFEPYEGTTVTHLVIPMYKHPEWNGHVARLRIGFGNPKPGADVTVQGFFTTYDTRHDINGQNYVIGCSTYFDWTGDINFLRRNVNRMRTALRYTMTEHQALERKFVFNTWVGHEGRSGLRFVNGEKQIAFGNGIGDNYWDIVPFGYKDCYASMMYYAALLRMARVEREIRAHPEWNVPVGTLAFEPDMLEKHAAEVKTVGNKMFWNPKTGRFIPCIDADGKTHDYGMTSPNMEAVYYDFATPEHARSIMAWLNGDRIVKGDTAQGADIYHWRFAPRGTTKRNTEYYFWGWSAPESIPWGAQVQDGGAVLGWSYHDLVDRVRVLGPDNAWARLQEIIRWFDEVQAAGGYRKYYDGSREGTLQGGGTAGGLGLDAEFFESVLVPQVMIDGFLGFAPMVDGFRLDPNIPSSWPSLAIDRIRWHDLVLTVRVTKDSVEIRREAGTPSGPLFIRFADSEWRPGASSVRKRASDGAYEVSLADVREVRFVRARRD